MSTKDKSDVVEDDDLDFELVTSARQLAAPPPLRKEKVTLEEWKTTSGKPARFLLWELTAAQWAEFMESGRVYKDGVFKRYDTKDEDLRFLAYTVRDQNGNRIWNTVDAAKGQLGHLGKASLNVLLNAANTVNSAKEAAEEGNSEEIQSVS
jgi:hypothetical protein